MATRIAGRDTLRRRLGAISAGTRRQVFRVLQQGGQLIADDAAQRIINPPKTGRVYPSTWRKGAMHQASAPGESPAADSGRLHQSITWVGHENALEVNVGTATPYAVRLELGDDAIEPRPFMSPAFRAAVPRVRAALTFVLRGAGARER